MNNANHAHRSILRSVLAAGALIVSCFAQTACIRIPDVVTLSLGPKGAELEKSVVIEEPGSTGEVALIEVAGLIAETSPSSAFGVSGNPVDRLVRRLQLAEDDDSVRAVLLRVNSPGGGVAASETMYREIRRFRERSGKPVVAVMGEVAASGGYYISLAADRIVAQRSTITGSIGVIIPTLNVADGMSRIGVSSRSVVSGPNKSLANPLEPVDEEHYAILQAMVDEFYGDFVELVRERRTTIEESDFARLTDGRVVSGAVAAEVGLVDATGGVREAHRIAAELAGLERSDLVRYAPQILSPKTPYASVEMPLASPSKTDVRGAFPASGADRLLRALGSSRTLTPGVYYLWLPPAGL
ncbi:MAG: signal peptide peptidase SppA [Planctomycetota bacterium]